MIVIPPAADCDTKFWRAQLEAQDLPTPELMSEQAAKWGLDLPEGWSGVNESPYLAAACGASLSAMLNFLSKKEAKRISLTPLSDEGMWDAALMELCAAGSFFDWGPLRHDFEIAKGLLGKRDLDYLALYYAQLTDARQAQNWIAQVATTDLAAGGTGLIPEGNVAHAERLFSLFHLRRPEQEPLRLLLTTFDPAELNWLLRKAGLSADEVCTIARLRSVLGREVAVEQLVAELRAMGARRLKLLLA